MTILSKLKEKLFMLKIIASIRSVLIRLAILVGSFVALVLIINLSIFDEELDLEIVKILQPTNMPPVKENAFYAFWGISAAADKNMIDSGIAVVERYQHNIKVKGSGELTDQDYIETLGGRNLDKTWGAQYPRCTALKEYGCLEKAVEQLKNNPIEDPRLKLMLTRYNTLTKMRSYKFAGEITATLPFPSYGIVMKLGQLQLASLYHSGNYSQFLNQLVKDMKFWKMILSQGNTLIEKMVATASLWSDVQYLSEYIRHNDLSPEQALIMQKLVQPLTQQQLDISLGFDGELQIISDAFNNYSNRESLSNDPFSFPPYLLLQTNATINNYYHGFVKPMKELSRKPSHELVSALELYRLQSDSQHDGCCIFGSDNLFSLWPSTLYNPTGKVLSVIAMPSASDYIARVHDLNGMIQLVKLQLELKMVDKELRINAIQNSKLRNLYTSKWIKFDQEKGMLKFDCLDKNPICQVKL